MSNITVTVNGQSGPNLTATSGDQIGVVVGPSPAAFNLTVTQAGAPGGQGIQGIQGPPSTTIDVGNVTTLPAGSSATVAATSSNSGANLTLAFGIPAGATGPAGAAGVDGTTPTFTVANVATLASSSNATVTATTTNNGANVALSFGLPKGADGAAGSNLTLSDATPSALGTASPGTSSTVSRADHTHQLPVISYANLTGVPTNFPSNTTLVSGLSAGYSAANHAHNYVTSLNNLTGALTLAAGSNVTLTANGSVLTLSSIGGGIGLNDAVDGGEYVGEIVYSGTITITQHPQNQTASNGAASFSAAATVSPTGTIAYQWQRSDNNGSTWLTVAGATASNVALTNLTYAADNGDRYRVIVSSDSASSVTSNAAVLTVIDNWSGSGTVSSKWTTTANFLEATFTAPQSGVLYIDYDFTVNVDTGYATGFGVYKNGTRQFGTGSQSSSAGSVNSSAFTTFATGDTILIRRETSVGGSLVLDTAGDRTINSMSLWLA